MTEAEWLARTNPKQLLLALAGRSPAVERKLFLFACACCRRIWPLLTDGRSRQAVEALERALEVEPREIRPARRLADEAFADKSPGWGKWAPWEALRPGRPHVRAQEASVWAARAVACGVSQFGHNGDQKTFEAERLAQCGLFRDIVANPYRPVGLDPAMRTPAVLSLAHAACQERELPSGRLDPARLAVLSDALEEAGCADAGILSHLRSSGPHVRGCWALDLILGKE